MLAPDNRGSKVIVKNWTDVVIPIYNWTEYSDIYSKILGNLCQYYGDEPALYNTGNIFYFSANNNSILFKLKKMTSWTDNDGRKYIEIMISLKYLSNLWSIIEMQLINC